MKQYVHLLVCPFAELSHASHPQIHIVHTVAPVPMCLCVYVYYLQLISQNPCLQSRERSCPSFSQHVKVACSLLEQLNDKGRGQRRGVGTQVRRCSWMYTADFNEARHLISNQGAPLDRCLANAFNTLSHSTLVGDSQSTGKWEYVFMCAGLGVGRGWGVGRGGVVFHRA